MSLVGTRPETTRFVKKYTPEMFATLLLPAGVTSEASIRYKDEARLTAALRNEQFFSLAELNAAIREKLEAYNARKFQKKECSRLSLFLGEEMPLLAPLPATPFELAEWKQATVVKLQRPSSK